MSIHDIPEPDPDHPAGLDPQDRATRRGGAAVARMADLGPVETGAIVCLRLWSEARAQDWIAALTRTQSPREAAAIHARLHELVELITHYGRRPLMRHALDCPCVGADEACFAQLIAAAGEGAQEDAALIASLLVRPDMARPLAVLAAQVGIALAQGARRQGRLPGHLPPRTRLH